jgi:flagellar assembly protein FliH
VERKRSLSKVFVRASSPVSIGAFATLLPKVEPNLDRGAKSGRLGRTAEATQRLQDEARALGHAEGREAGFQEGREAGLSAVWAEMEESMAAFRSALDSAAERVDKNMADWYRASEQRLAELSVVIAARILGKELTLGNDTITSLVRDALKEVTTADKVRIRVHPFDSPVLEKEKKRILSSNTTIRNVDIVDDPSISGGAKIESDSGMIDATIRTQLELAINAIRGRD